MPYAEFTGKLDAPAKASFVPFSGDLDPPSNLSNESGVNTLEGPLGVTPSTGSTDPTFTATAPPQAGAGRGLVNPPLIGAKESVQATADRLDKNMSGSAIAGVRDMGAAAGIATLAPAKAIDFVSSLITGKDQTGAQDYAGRTFIDPNITAAEHWAPTEADQPNIVDKVVNGLARMLPTFAAAAATGGASAPAALPAYGMEAVKQAVAAGMRSMSVPAFSAGIDKSAELIRKGAPLGEAITAGLTEGATSDLTGGLAMSTPGANIAKRFVQGAAVGETTGDVARQAQNLAAPDFQTPRTPEGTLISALTGGVLASGMAHPTPHDNFARPVEATKTPDVDPIAKIAAAPDVDSAIAAAQEAVSAGPSVADQVRPLEQTLEQQLASLQKQKAADVSASPDFPGVAADAAGARVPEPGVGLEAGVGTDRAAGPAVDAGRDGDQSAGGAVQPADGNAAGAGPDAVAPAKTWFGRAGDGYKTIGDAQMALPSRQKVDADLSWRVEPMPNGKFRLAGYEAEGAKSGDAADARPTQIAHSPDEGASAAADSAGERGAALRVQELRPAPVAEGEAGIAPRDVGARADEGTHPAGPEAPVEPPKTPPTSGISTSEPTISLGKTGGPGPAGGKTSRARSYDKNPFLTFLAERGLYHVKDQPNSQKSEFSPDKQISVPGYHVALFRRDGKQPDVLVQPAIEAGYLPHGADEQQLVNLIHRAVGGERIAPLYAEGEAEKEMQARIQAHIEAHEELADLTPEDLADSRYAKADPELQARVRELIAKAEQGGIDHEGILEDVAKKDQNATQDEYHAAASQALEAALAEQGSARAENRSGPAGEKAPEQGQAEGLTRPSREDILAQQERSQQGEREAAQRRTEEDSRARADAQRDEFGLTGSDRPADANPDQTPMFARAEPFYSALSHEVQGINAKAQGADGWRAQIQGLIAKGKVKADEVAWTGLDDWLKLQSGKVTKEQITDYLKANGVQVKDVTKSAEPKMEEVRNRYMRAMVREGESASQADQLFREMQAFAEDRPHDEAMKDRGFELVMKDGRYTGNEIHDAGQAGATKYGQYALPGGENYREVLLTLPPSSVVEPVIAEGRWRLRVKSTGEFMRANGSKVIGFDSEGEARKAIGQLSDPGMDHFAPGYKSSHWSEANVLAHIRLNDRIDADGKKVLFVEEIQSDWGQAGKKQGFAPKDTHNPTDAEVQAFFDLKPGADPADYRQEMIEALQKRDRAGTVPNAPFVGKTDAWVSLAIKRIVKMAVDEGYDKVAFVNGEQSAKRYSLSKQVDSVAWESTRTDGAAKNVELRLPNQNPVRLRVDGDGAVLAANGPGFSQFEGKQLDDVIGKDLAKKIMGETTNGSLSGEGLNIGGEGMKAFYDKIVPSVAKDVLRKLGGGQLGTVELQIPGHQAGEFDPHSGVTIGPNGVAGKNLDATGFDITPAMRDKAAGGLPLFKRSSITATGGAMKTAELRKTLAAPLEKLQIPHFIHDTAEAASQATGQHIPDDAKGFHWKGRIHLIAENIGSRLEAQEVFWHEVQHAGLNESLGTGSKAYEDALRGISLQNKNIRDAAKAWMDRHGEEDYNYRIARGATPERAMYRTKLQAVDEALAELSGRKGENINGLAKFVAKVQEFLRSIGLHDLAKWMESRTDAEALSMILGSREAVMGQGREQRQGEMSPAFSKDKPSFAKDDPKREIQVDGVWHPAENSKGQPIHPTFEGQKKFWRWFGKSAVTDEQGRPAVMYHGTPESFSAFEPDRNGLMFVTSKPEFAAKFAQRYAGVTSGTENIMPVYVSAKRPFDPTLPADRQKLIDRLLAIHPSYKMGDGELALVIDGRKTLYSEGVLDETLKNPESNWGFLEHKSIVDAVERAGFDSMYVIEDGTKNLAVFAPEQLKSATGNRGTFDPNEANISFARAKTAEEAPDRKRLIDKLGDGYSAYGGVEQVKRESRGSVADSIAKALIPAGRKDAELTAGIIRGNLGEQARGREVAQEHLIEFAKRFDKMPVEDNYKFIDAMERGVPLKDPEMSRAAVAIRKVLDERRDQVIALGKGNLENFNENYFPHIWKDRSAAADLFSGKPGDALSKVMSRRPLEGGKGFLKQRTYDFFSDGLKAGLEPVTTNPVELAMLKAREMDRYIYGQRIFQEMKAAGVAKFVGFGDKAPDGWVKINDKIARVMQYSEAEKAMILRGEYYAPEQAATLINNHLSPGLSGVAAFDMVRKAGNMMNAAQLGLSAFHLGFTTLDAMISKAALGIKQGSRGDILKGAGNVAQSLNPIQPLMNLYKGDKLLKAYLGNLNDPQIAPIVEALTQAGGRVKMDDVYRNAAINEFRQAIRKGNYGTAALKAIPRAMDLINKPIFEYLVPRQKLGVFFDMAKDALESKPDMSLEQKRAVMGKLWDSVDNRMGELVYDNVFWNRALKDALMVSVRSVGWNLGTFREIGGGIKDIKDIPKLGGLSDRTAYIFGLTFVTAIIGSMTQYLLTGEGPKELKDVFFPRTGKERPDGTQDRLSLPSYMKDVFEYGHDIRNFAKYGEDPFHTLENKLHPLISTLGQVFTNKDFFGGAIRSPGDSGTQQALDEATYALKQMTPFSLRNYQQQAKLKGEEPSIAGYLSSPSMIGITPAPGYITKSDEQAESSQVNKMHDSLMTKFREEMRDGADWGEILQRAWDAGITSPSDLAYIRKSAEQRPPKRVKEFATH